MDTRNIELEPGDMKQCRESLGMSQEQIAERLGIDRSTWTRWENGSLQNRHPRMLKAALNYLLIEGQIGTSRVEHEVDDE